MKDQGWHRRDMMVMAGAQCAYLLARKRVALTAVQLATQPSFPVPRIDCTVGVAPRSPIARVVCAAPPPHTLVAPSLCEIALALTSMA